MKKIKFCFFILLMGLFSSSCQSVSSRSALFGSDEYDVVLEATPFKVKGITSESVVDAVEDGFDSAGFDSAVVMFAIDKVLTGEFTQVRAGGASKLQQMKDAARDHDFWRILKSDFTDPNEMTEQKWISVAVQDPKLTFGFPSWGTTVGQPYKLYLKRLSDQPKSYVLVKNHLKS